MTIIDFTLFAKIKPAELLNQVWESNVIISVMSTVVIVMPTVVIVVPTVVFATVMLHFLLQAWQKPKYKHRAVNILRLVERMNNLTLWVATTILSQKVKGP